MTTPAETNAHQIMGDEITPRPGTWQAEAHANGRKFFGPAGQSVQSAEEEQSTDSSDTAAGQTAEVAPSDTAELAHSMVAHEAALEPIPAVEPDIVRGYN